MNYQFALILVSVSSIVVLCVLAGIIIDKHLKRRNKEIQRKCDAYLRQLHQFQCAGLLNPNLKSSVLHAVDVGVSTTPEPIAGKSLDEITAHGVYSSSPHHSSSLPNLPSDRHE